MKRLISLMCSMLLVLSCFVFAPCVSAAEDELFGAQVLISKTVEYLEDGSIITTSVYENVVSSRSNLYNKSGTKERVYTDVDGNIVWSLTVYGEFRVIEGASVTCTSASCSSQVFHENWSCTRKSAAPSGSQAVANGKFQKTLLGIVLDTENVIVTLSCDTYGNLY